MTDELRRTPLFEEHLALGARMVPFAGWEMPVQYTGIMEEHRAVRECAGIFDICHMGEFRVFGFGAFDTLQRLFTNDLAHIAEVGHAQYTLMLNEGGGIMDDLIVYHSGDLEYLIVANAANRTSDFEWIKGRAPADLEVVDESDRTGLVALQGPKALGVARELAEEGWQPPDRFHIGEVTLDRVPALAARTGYTGEDGLEFFTRASDAPRLWRLLLSFSEVTPVGLGARDTLRLEMGYRLYGLDMDHETDPISAGLGWVVPSDKRGYVGAETVERVRAEKPRRRLVGLRVDDGIPRHGYPVLHEGEEVGMVASGTFSPTLETGIATAYVPAELSASGTRLEVAIRRKTVGAEVEDLPFLKKTSLSSSS